MNELLQQLANHLRAIWQRRWLGLLVAWLVALIGAIVIYRMPDKYEAYARVYVDTQSLLKPLMSGLAVQPDIDQQLSILSRTLISRPNVEKLIRMTDLDLNLPSAKDREELIEELMRTLAIRGVVHDNLYTIAFRHTGQEQAKKVVQALLSIFVESSLGDKRKDSDSARRFIEEQIKVYEAKLEEAENRLKEFKLKNMALTGDGGSYFTRMGSLNEELARARVELRSAEESRDALKRELQGEDPVFLGSPNGGDSMSGIVPEIDVRIEALKKNLDELLRGFTDQHPDVIGTKRIIEQLERERSEAVASRKKSPTQQMGAADRNPVYQQIKISLADSEAKVAALRARLTDTEARANTLKASARMMPQVETEFTQLNRDYEVQKRNYENLVTRRESASMSGDMEASAGVADFRVIDPPRVSLGPVAPNRVLLLSLTLLGALAAGIFASFAVSQIYPTFHESRTLRKIANRPVLGSVSLLPTEAEVQHRRRGAALFVSAVSTLVALYGAAILFLFATTSRI
jgi:polysaccharide chain length determinant protein (PEP-CTERM system associated)